MNIIKIQDQLKNAPDDALVGYVQNPTGQVPTYLALSELQRRKTMRENYQQQQAPQTTVAEELAQEAQPQPQPQMQGVAGLPEAQPMMEAMQPPPAMPMEQMAQGGLAELDVGDMYDENNYASGGIVAFDEGGDVPGFAGPEGSYVNPGLYGGPVEEYEPWYKSMKLFGTKYNLYGDGLLGPNPDQDTIRAFENQRSMNPFISGMPRTDLADEYARLRLKASQNKATQKDYDRMNEINESMKAAENYPTGGGWTKEKQAEADAKAAKEKADADRAARDKAYKDVGSNIGAGGAREKVRSLADYTNEFKDLVGTDPMQAKLAERLEKMDSRAAKMEEQAPWMALAQAGFEMASARPEYGKGQSAFADIARGATAGIKSYSDARDRMATLEERRFGLVSDMAKAQRAEQLAIASKGIDSREAALARDQQYKIHQEDQALKVKLSVIENTFDLQKAQAVAAAKDMPDAVERATKIDPLVLDDKDYKEGLKALESKYGDKGVIPGSPNHDKYQADVEKLYRQVYIKKIRNPLAASSFGAGALSYTPGKGFN